MEIVSNIITVLGIMVCSYTAAHLLSPVVKKHDGDPSPPLYIKLLGAICVILYFCSAVVAILNDALWSKPYVDAAVADARKTSDTAIAVKDKEISRLRDRLALYEPPDV